MSRFIGITLGDVTGVGPEVALKALKTEAAADDARYLILGDEHLCLQLNERLKLGLPLRPLAESEQGGRFFSPIPFPNASRMMRRRDRASRRGLRSAGWKTGRADA